MASIRLLHIADVHLDAPFRWLGDRGKEQRGQLKETFRGIIDLALEERVDVFLVAGDLFDSNSPSQGTIDLVQTQLRRLDTPVFLLPGTHDCLDDSSVYRKLNIAGSNIHIFDPSQTSFEVNDLDLTVHGRANVTRTSWRSPLDGLSKSAAARFNVALAHGSMAMPGTEDDFPLTRGEIGASGMDYVALGHWHSCQEYSAAATKAFYSGPPELLAEGQSGCALLVELGQDGATVERRYVGRRSYTSLDVALDGMRSVEEIRERIKRLGDENLVLSVTLSGLRSLDLVVDAAELARELSEYFFHVKVQDRSQALVSPEDITGFSEKLVIGQFVRRMMALIDQAATPEDRRIRENALQIGVALLQGRDVLR
ncbi:MAG: DNA repair exonuclease [Chloroflexi bacterium]|nr:DNA repair exonuclease [Chloroflexota bacterium]